MNYKTCNKRIKYSHLKDDIEEFWYIDWDYTPKYFKEILNTETVRLNEININENYITFTWLSFTYYDFQESKTLKKYYKAYAKKIQKFIKKKYDLDFTIFIKGLICEANGKYNII